MTDKTIKSCLLCGVGGQGTVLASRIIAAAAMEKGRRARTAETIGMAQRGGSVVSHVRTGDEIPSPMIPKGRTDILIGFEPGEAAANIEYLKANGTLILCAQEVKPITASLGRSAYDGNECIDYLRSKVDRFYTIDVEKIIEECGTSKVLNVAVVGALCASGEMDLAIEDVDRVLGIRMKPKLVDVNRKALRMGAACIG